MGPERSLMSLAFSLKKFTKCIVFYSKTSHVSFCRKYTDFLQNYSQGEAPGPPFTPSPAAGFLGTTGCGPSEAAGNPR